MSDTKIPDQIIATLETWDKDDAGYMVQIGEHNRTIAYAWRPKVAGQSDDDLIAEVNAIADRLIDGRNYEKVITDCHSLIAMLKQESERFERNRNMWRDQCARQAAALTQLRADNAELNQMVRALKGDQPATAHRPFFAWEGCTFADGDIIEIRERDGSQVVMKVGSVSFKTALADLGVRMPVRAATEEQSAPWRKQS